MLTVQIPMLLALLGTALMAVVIFAPSRVAAPVTVSFAPPIPPALEQWEPYSSEPWEAPAVEEPVAVSSPKAAVASAAWPALVDQRASGCDAAARLGLVEALGAVRTPWAEAILRRALDEEHDPAVRDAVAAALRGEAA